MIVDDHDLGLEELFDRANITFFFACAQRDGKTFRTGTAGTTDTVDVGLRALRHVEVDDVWQFAHINAAGGNIRGNQDARAAGFEVAQGFLTSRL
jgi:hypothetical protein